MSDFVSPLIAEVPTILISEYCGRTCAPKEFVSQFIAMAERTVGVKFVDVDGSYADTYTICEFAPCVNLSAGYYNAHTSDDFVDMGELYNIMLVVKASIENVWELVAAVNRAPVNWFKDKYAGNKNYVRGKYIGAAYGGDYWYGYGGGYGITTQAGINGSWVKPTVYMYQKR